MPRVQQIHVMPKGRNGFTIIEIMIVMVLVGTMLTLLFYGIPTLQRNMRNRQRDSDALLIKNAINECMLSNKNNRIACNEPHEINIDSSELGMYTGIISGGTQNSQGQYIQQIPPTIDEPNWLFGLKCTPNRRWFQEVDPKNQFVVTYRRENPSNNDGYENFCIDGVP